MPVATNVTEILCPTNNGFFGYWQSLVIEGRPPQKSEINPGAIPKIIPGLVIYERRSADTFLIRLMGTRVVHRLGLDLTGRNLLDFSSYAAKEETQRDLNRLLDERSGQFLTVRDRFTSGREALVEIVRLPLNDQEGETRFIIGCTHEYKTTGWRCYRQDQPELMAERIQSVFFDIVGDLLTETLWVNPDYRDLQGLPPLEDFLHDTPTYASKSR